MRDDDTYDIDYDDGEKETRVKQELIRPLEKPKSRRDDLDLDAEKEKIVEGTKVEARFKGRSKYYPGKVSRVRLNGTYDIDYDDGEKEASVTKDLIRVLEKPSRGRSGGSDRDAVRLEEGMKVEAQYKGRSKFYPGRIVRVRDDDTYDIDYDDGEKETRVKQELIRPLEKPKSRRDDQIGRAHV